MELKPGKCSGFTLLEMLVALAISAGIAVIAYRALDGAILAEEKINRATQEIDELDRVRQYLNNDMLYAVGRVWKDHFGEPRSALEGIGDDRLSTSELVADEDYLLRLIRSNRDNLQDLPRSNLYVVGYRLTQDEDNQTRTLWRDSWGPVDGSNEPTVQQRQLLNGINTLSFEYLSASFESLSDEAWLSQWPATRGISSPKLPVAVRLTLGTDALGELQWLFQLTAGED